MKHTYSSLKSRVLSVLFSSVLALTLFSMVKSSPAYSMDLQAGFRLGIDFTENNGFTDSLMVMPLDLGIYWKIIPNLYIGSNILWYYHSENNISVNWISANLDSTYRFLRLVKKKLHLYAKLEIGIFNYLSLKNSNDDSGSDDDQVRATYELSKIGQGFITISSIEPKVEGAEYNITHPNFRIGAGAKWKLNKKLYVYSEALISFFSLEFKYKNPYLDKTTTDERSFKALMFTGGIFYTI